MKNILLLLVAIFTLNGCEDDNNKSKTELEKLPPATQTGKNTIGCLVNGKALVPYGYLQTKRVCQYTDGLNFNISVGEKKNNVIRSIHVISYNESLEVGQIYQLKEYGANSKFGEFTIFTNDGSGNKGYSTTEEITGEFIITHHDFDHAILSGTFWFDAVNLNGEKVEIREGRFDMHYTD